LRQLEVNPETVENALNPKMASHSNLYAPNSYYEVVQPFRLWKIERWQHRGYYGAAEILTAKWIEFTAHAGATISNLHGGLFYREPNRDLKGSERGIQVAMGTRDVSAWQKYDRFPLHALKLRGVSNQIGWEE
jgi:hypothetical protein